LATNYLRSLPDGPWELPASLTDHVYYRFVIRPHRGATRLLSELEKHGIEARRPVFRPLNRDLGLEGFPGAEEAYRTAVSIPLYPALSWKEEEYVIKSTQRAGNSIAG
jgi:dTDP-4-amino-4,6-dideoxygalactose transaminase